MTSTDKIILSAMLLGSFIIIVVGGLYHPNTLAGAVARFVFSCN